MSANAPGWLEFSHTPISTESPLMGEQLSEANVLWTVGSLLPVHVSGMLATLLMCSRWFLITLYSRYC